MNASPASREIPPARLVDAPIHPLAAALLVFVDNLWMLADWNAVTWLFTIPLSFGSVALFTTLIQRFLHRNTWGKSLGKGFLLGVIAGVPTSLMGTPVGLGLLALAGMRRANAALSSVEAVKPEFKSAHATSPPVVPIEAHIISVTAAPPSLPSAAPTAPPRRMEPWWVKIVIVLLLCGTALLATKLVLDRVGGMAEKFRQQHITETFTAALPTLARTPGGNLELATATATETLTRADERTIAWDMIYLGKTISEISVPVTYRYHLSLRDPWRLNVSGNTCVVHAPAIRPSLPPAIHTDQMRKRSEAGWARLDAREQMAELERSLTPRLIRHAGDPRRLAIVREECRKTVAEFVRDWLVREEHWRHDRFSSIKVVFADESDPKPGLARPAVTLR